MRYKCLICEKLKKVFIADNRKVIRKHVKELHNIKSDKSDYKGQANHTKMCHSLITASYKSIKK